MAVGGSPGELGPYNVNISVNKGVYKSRPPGRHGDEFRTYLRGLSKEFGSCLPSRGQNFEEGR